jgi:ribonuclease P protein component
MKTLSNIEANGLFNKGKWLTTENISAVYLHSDVFKYMVSAPIKRYRKAVDRNKIKRILRSSICVNENKNINIAFIYKGDININSSIVRKEIKQIYEKILKDLL